MQSDAATRPQDRAHFGRGSRSTAISIYGGGAADAHSVGWPASIVVGVNVWRFRLRAISPLPRPPRAAPPPPYPTTPRRASPPYPARPTSWRSCHPHLPSVVRAAQPAAQADAAARPEDAGHFGAQSRHERDTGVSWQRSLAASRWTAT